MSEAMLKVLEMIKDGVITPEEGQQLIEAMKEDVKPDVAPKAKPQKKVSKKLLRVKVDSADGDKVNVKIPLGIAKAIMKDGKLPIPDDKLGDLDIDLDGILEMLDGDELDGDIVNVDSADGDVIRIFIE
jgi:hypothetical protein